MKIVKVRFADSVMAFNEDAAPVKYRFEVPSKGVIIEVRHDRDSQRVFVYGKQDLNGTVIYAGKRTGFWSGRQVEMFTHVSKELVSMGRRFKLTHHCVWGFIEQLPLYTSNGVEVEKALALKGPILDLVAAGAPHTEITASLKIDSDLLDFVLGHPTDMSLPPEW